jgi:quercetin dioxygenase-like cupin family protein
MTEVRITRWDALPEQRFTPTVAVRTVNAEGCQLCRFTIEEGTPAMPPVHHEAEQLTVMFAGHQRVRLGDLEHEVSGGSLWTIPARLEHASELIQLPSSILDFHVPHRPQFLPGGGTQEPPPGPAGERPARFSTWADEPPEPDPGGERRRLTADRGELTRLAGDGPFAIAAGGERIVSLEQGTVRVEAGEHSAQAAAGAVWTVPAGVAQTITVLEGPVEILDFHDIRPRQEAA